MHKPLINHRPRIHAAQATGLSYKDSGVDIDAGAELVRRIQKLNPSIGGFSGLVPFGDILQQDKEMRFQYGLHEMQTQCRA